MCQKLIEKYVCGDDESSTFPCEGFFDTGTCETPEEDKIIDHKDKKCPECKHLDEALQRIAEDANLAPEPKRGGVEAADPNAPKKYFKEYIKWSKCGHLSHPKWTNIERFDDGPEIGFETEGIGRCHGCAEADPRTLARMERDGVLHTADPWGFMEAEPDVAVGSSATGEHMSNQAIAMGITDSALADLHGPPPFGGSVVPPLPGYNTTMGNTSATAARASDGINHGDSWSRSPSPEFHPGNAKGKGRHGHDEDTYASRYGGDESSSDDDDDRSVHSSGSPPRGRSNAAAFRRPHFATSDDDDDDDDDDAPASQVPQSWGSAPTGRYARGGGRAPAGRGSNNPGPNDGAFIEISAAERRRLGIPGGMQLTAETLRRFQQRRGDEGRLAMRQDAEGAVGE